MSSAENTQPLEDVAPVQGDNAGHQIKPLYALESRLFHHDLERRLVRVHADRFGEIAVTRLVAGHELAKAWQDIKAVPVVGRLERWRDFAEFEHQDDTAWPQDATHFRQCNFLMR